MVNTKGKPGRHGYHFITIAVGVLTVLVAFSPLAPLLGLRGRADTEVFALFGLVVVGAGLYRVLRGTERSVLLSLLVATALPAIGVGVHVVASSPAGAASGDALMSAVVRGNCARVTELLADGADPNRAAGRIVVGPLHYAARDGDACIIRALIAGGGDVNQRDGKGRTPLMYAATAREAASTVKMLLDAGAAAQVRDGSGLRAGDLTEDAEVRALLLE